MDTLKQGGFTGLVAKGYFLDTRVGNKPCLPDRLKSLPAPTDI